MWPNEKYEKVPAITLGWEGEFCNYMGTDGEPWVKIDRSYQCFKGQAVILHVREGKVVHVDKR